MLFRECCATVSKNLSLQDNQSPEFNPNKAGIFEGSFSFGGGGVNLTPSSYLKMNLSNIKITLYNC